MNLEGLSSHISECRRWIGGGLGRGANVCFQGSMCFFPWICLSLYSSQSSKPGEEVMRS